MRSPLPTAVAEPRLRDLMRKAGVGRGLLKARRWTRLIVDGDYRRSELQSWRDYRAFRRQHGAALGVPLFPNGHLRRSLIVSKGTLKDAHVEVALIKALQLGGFSSTVLTQRSDLEKLYRLAVIDGVVRWEGFTDRPRQQEADAIVRSASRLEDILAFEHEGARVGKFALSTTFRTLREGSIDLGDPRTRQVLQQHLASGIARATAAHRLLDSTTPDLAVFMGNRYTGQGELMDVCLARGIDVITWFDAHRSSALMLKRYAAGNRDRHHGSIGDETWSWLTRMPWTERHRAALRRELHDGYASGDWYSRGGTQVNKTVVDRDRLLRTLRLDPTKPTAVIFPHIVWDATLFWGADLFPNYEDWLVATAKAACANERLNWVIKIHPAHVAKAEHDRYTDEPAELEILRRRVGPLPAHVTVIPPDTTINTWSLFAIMQCCLTVRGTIGIEAACMGIRVLTAGTGRYDHRGFTVDSDSREQYLQRLMTLERVPAMTDAERDLAERFAYGAFVARPWPLTTWTIDHGRDRGASMTVRMNARSADELRAASDLRALALWAADGRREDFVWAAGGSGDA